MIRRYTPNKLRGGVVLSFAVAVALSHHALTMRAVIAWDVFYVLLGFWVLRGLLRWVGKQLRMVPKTPES